MSAAVGASWHDIPHRFLARREVGSKLELDDASGLGSSLPFSICKLASRVHQTQSRAGWTRARWSWTAGIEGSPDPVARRVDAGKVELDGARYLGFDLPFSISQLVWIEALLVGGAEVYRNRELDTELRIYPGARLGPWLMKLSGTRAHDDIHSTAAVYGICVVVFQNIHKAQTVTWHIVRAPHLHAERELAGHKWCC